MKTDALVIAPFRRPTFRQAISERYPVQEPWDSPPLTVAAGLQSGGLSTDYLALQNIFHAWNEDRDLPRLREVLVDVPARMVVFAGDYFIPSRSTATLFGIRIVSRELRRMNPDVVVGVAGRLATTAGASVLESVPECDFVRRGSSRRWPWHQPTLRAEPGLKGTRFPLARFPGGVTSFHTRASHRVARYPAYPQRA